MALPASGLIKISQIASELAIALVTFRLNSSASRNFGGVATGTIKLSDFYGKQNQIVITISASTTDVNLSALAGSPTVAGNYRFVVNAGVVIGQVNASAAVVVGEFPSGSVVNLDNYGSIYGKAGQGQGAGPATVGGDAINASAANNFTFNVNNMAGAQVYAGGGGGGQGGQGGQGGTGGSGSYQVANCPAGYRSVNTNFVSCTDACQNDIGASWYCGIGCHEQWNMDGKGGGYSTYWCDNCCYLSTVGSAGGVGGQGGTGGFGGNGQGYNAAATAGANGSAGAAGAAGGPNAGAGGQGGAGGLGGAGGTWGQAGGDGSSGATGSTGANGNAGSGTAGAAGIGGGTGARAGRYLVRGSLSNQFNNSGSIAGGVL